MKSMRWVPLLVPLFALTPGPLLAQTCGRILAPTADGDVRLCEIDGDSVVVMPRAVFNGITARMEDLADARQFIQNEVPAFAASAQTLRDASERTEQVADSLIALQEAQIDDYERLTTVLDRLSRFGSLFTLEAGLGANTEGEFAGLAGVGIWGVTAWTVVDKDLDFGWFFGFRRSVF